LGELTKLSRDELNRICYEEKPGAEKHLAIKLGNNYLNIISPFLWHAQFSFDGRNFFTNTSRAVKQSGEKLEDFLVSFQSGSQNEVGLKSLLHL